MKTIIYILLTSCVLLVSCNSKNRKTVQIIENKSIIEEIEKEPIFGNPIDYDSTKVLYQLFVTNRKGTQLKDQADEHSKSAGTFRFGSIVNVIEEQKDWLGIKERISREYTRNGREIQVSKWEKVFVKKSDVGNAEKITLIEEDLIQGYVYKDSILPQKIENLLELSFISKEDYLTKKAQRVRFLVEDSASIKKIKGVISLPCKNGVKKIIDIDEPDNEDGRMIYGYVGNIDMLNQYLLGVTFYEGGNYILIDKKSGKETRNLVGIPHISPNKKYMISMSANIYEECTDFQLYTLKNNEIKLRFGISFANYPLCIKKG